GTTHRTLTEFRARHSDFKGSIPGAQCRTMQAWPSIGVGIVPRAEFHAKRRPDQFEVVPEPAFEIAPIGIAHMLQRTAMDHDDRWVLPALVRIAHLGPDRTAASRLLAFDRLLQGAGQLRRGKFPHGGRMGFIDRFHEGPDPRRGQCGDEMHPRKAQEMQLAVELAAYALALAGI